MLLLPLLLEVPDVEGLPAELLELPELLLLLEPDLAVLLGLLADDPDSVPLEPLLPLLLLLLVVVVLPAAPIAAGLPSPILAPDGCLVTYTL